MKTSNRMVIWVAVLATLTACSRTKAPTEVATLAVTSQPAQVSAELPGRTAPYRIAEVRPRISGLIQKQLFTEGADVEEGQILYQIDPAPLQADLDNAHASLVCAEASLLALELRAQRYRIALDDGAVSQREFDDVSVALNQARAGIAHYRAMVETARSNLDHSRVVAPLAGRIGRSSVVVGTIVTANQPVPLAIIQQIDPIYVDIPLTTTGAWELERRLKPVRDESNQHKAQLRLEDGTVYPWEGALESREPAVDRVTGSVLLRAVFPNPDRVLLPAMFVQAVVKEDGNDEVLAWR